ncbi:hypothetical protein JOD97_001035 [Duganella sp. 1411]|nr:hypothetical protein [Duganella sp. 1411]MBP1203021.1 hypothetical protein [Duganella sp. 1411]
MTAQNADQVAGWNGQSGERWAAQPGPRTKALRKVGLQRKD